MTEMFNTLLIKHWWTDASITEKQWPGVPIDNVMTSKCFPNSLVHLHKCLLKKKSHRESIKTTSNHYYSFLLLQKLA